MSGQNSSTHFHKFKLWLFKFDNNDCHGHSQVGWYIDHQHERVKTGSCSEKGSVGFGLKAD